MAGILNPPPSLKQIAPFLKHAHQLEKHDPIMAYYCRYYAVQEGIHLRGSHPDEETKRFLIGLMDQLEKTKQQLGNTLDVPDFGEKHVKAFALRVFQMADDQDRAGNADSNTAKNFYASFQFLDVLSQFGTLSPELAEKQKYAKWKAANINQALKKGEKPPPGPPADESAVPTQFPKNRGVFGSEAETFLETQTPDSIPIPNFPQLIGNSNSGIPNFPQLSGNSNSGIPNFPQLSGNSSGIPTHIPSPDDCDKATKYAKFVISALQFDDIPAAVKNLQLALKALTGT